MRQKLNVAHQKPEQEPLHTPCVQRLDARRLVNAASDGTGRAHFRSNCHQHILVRREGEWATEANTIHWKHPVQLQSKAETNLN